MAITYKKLLENESNKELAETAQNARQMAMELGEMFERISGRLQSEPKNSPKGILSDSLKAWSEHLSNISQHPENEDAEKTMPASLKQMNQMQQFMAMKVPGSNKTFYEMTLDEMNTEGAEQQVDETLVRRAFKNALTTIGDYYEVPIDIEDLDPVLEFYGDEKAIEDQRPIKEKVEEEIRDIEDLDAIMEQREAEIEEERLEQERDPAGMAADFFSQEDKRIRDEQRRAAEEQRTEQAPGMVADFFEQADELLGPGDGAIISYEKLQEKNEREEGFLSDEGVERMAELGFQLRLASERIEQAGDERLGKQISEYITDISNASVESNEPVVRNALGKLSGFKAFLEKETNGKTNYERISEALDEEKRPSLDANLKELNNILELQMNVDALHRAQQVQQAEPPAEQQEEEKEEEIKEEVPPVVQQAEQPVEQAQEQQPEANEAEKRPDDLNVPKDPWPEGVQPAGQIVSFQELYQQSLEGKGFHNTKAGDRVQELGKMFETQAKALEKEGKTELAQQFNDYGEALFAVTYGHYEEETPKALSKLGGLKGFLEQKGPDGKTNYQLIADTLQKTNEKKFLDENIRQFESVAKTGIDLNALNPAPQQVSPEEERKHYATILDGLNSCFNEMGNDTAAEIEVFRASTACDALADSKDNRAHASKIHTKLGTVSALYATKEDAKEYLNERMGGIWDIKLDNGKTVIEHMRDRCKDEQELEKLNNAIRFTQERHKGVMHDPVPTKEGEINNAEHLANLKKGTNALTGPEALKTHLAQILIARDKNEDNPAKLADPAAQAEEAEQLKNTEAFKHATENLKENALKNSCQNPDAFISQLASEQKKVNAYKIPASRLASFTKNADDVCATMDATRNGSWLGIPRTRNSKEYQAARQAIEEARSRGGKDVDSNYRAVQSVKNYLSDKMEVRKREFGNVRFNECMKFLKSAMPENEFKQYVDEVNSKRKDPKTHVHVEDFEPRRNVDEIVADQQKLLSDKDRQPSVRDVAKIVAAYHIVSNVDEVIDTKNHSYKDALKEGNVVHLETNQKIDGKNLREMTDRIMGNEKFQEYIKTNGMEKAVELAQKNPLKLTGYAWETERRAAQVDAAAKEARDIFNNKAQRAAWFKGLNDEQKQKAIQFKNAKNGKGVMDMIRDTILEKRNQQPNKEEEPQQIVNEEEQKDEQLLNV